MNLNMALIMLSVLIIFFIVGIALPADSAQWYIAAIVATVVGSVNGVISLIIERQQRQLRHHIVGDIREMLIDRLRNRLAVIQLNVHLARATDQRRVEKIAQSIAEIETELDTLSPEALHQWKAHYSEYFDYQAISSETEKRRIS